MNKYTILIILGAAVLISIAILIIKNRYKSQNEYVFIDLMGEYAMLTGIKNDNNRYDAVITSNGKVTRIPTNSKKTDLSWALDTIHLYNIEVSDEYESQAKK